MEATVIKPQEGFQTKALQTSADIAIVGGSAGGGKTALLLMEAARWHFVENYGAVIFRRTYTEVTQQDGLWDQSKKFYEPLGGQSNETFLRWSFDSGSRISFSHLQHESDLKTHQGAQYAFIGFDELTHFTRKEFVYLMSRNRSVCGVDPVIRATCNPDPSSWVAEFIAWFIDQETGYPIPERCGQLRYFTSDGGNFVWGDSRQEVVDKCPHIFNDPALLKTGIDPLSLVKSMTFIAGSVYENKILLSADPRYLGNLLAMDEEEKARLLDGNWKHGNDDMELFPIPKLDDMFSAILPTTNFTDYYITIDHAREGKDLCTIFTWRTWSVLRIDILPLSNSHEVIRVVQHIRQIYRPIPVSRIIVDQDGIGVQDILGCKVFQGASASVTLTKELKPMYKNKRAQGYYKASEKVKDSQVSVDLNEVYLWERDSKGILQAGRKITEIKIKGVTYPIKTLIKDDLRTVKKFKADSEGKKQITPKDQQKNLLLRSPDFGDQFMIRAEFETIPQPVTHRRR